MRHDYQPLLASTKITALRPTQMTAGFREVARKRHAWREAADRDGSAFLGRHMIPVVLGPRNRPWLIDHHHLALALHQEGQDHVLTSIVADLSGLKRAEFLTVMDNRSWLHPFDAVGERHGYRKLPRTIADLTDDPYRSLAGAVRRAGGYAKSETPFAEFLWADFLRRRIAAKQVEHDVETATQAALKLARTPAAAHLPGWAGPEGRD